MGNRESGTGESESSSSEDSEVRSVYFCGGSPVEMNPSNDFRDLRVWVSGVDLATRIYEITASFPRSEQTGLAHQLRRAAVSVPSNIAEGNARSSLRDYIRHLKIARGSLAETYTQVEIARRVRLISDLDATTLLNQIDQVRKQLQALINALGKRLRSQS
ncbi:MAG: four helix bundle protein [Thermoanaerobaculia bacterium]|nr:four helix bundle protein [Thermoanaerobaculia bacterium]